MISRKSLGQLLPQPVTVPSSSVTSSPQKPETKLDGVIDNPTNLQKNPSSVDLQSPLNSSVVSNKPQPDKASPVMAKSPVISSSSTTDVSSPPKQISSNQPGKSSTPGKVRASTSKNVVNDTNPSKTSISKDSVTKTPVVAKYPSQPQIRSSSVKKPSAPKKNSTPIKSIFSAAASLVSSVGIGLKRTPSAQPKRSANPPTSTNETNLSKTNSSKSLIPTSKRASSVPKPSPATKEKPKEAVKTIAQPHAHKTSFNLNSSLNSEHIKKSLSLVQPQTQSQGQTQTQPHPLIPFSSSTPRKGVQSYMEKKRTEKLLEEKTKTLKEKRKQLKNMKIQEKLDELDKQVKDIFEKHKLGKKFVGADKKKKQQILEKRKKLMELFTDVSFFPPNREIGEERTEKDKFEYEDMGEEDFLEEDEEISKINSRQNSKRDLLEGYGNLRFTPASTTPKKLDDSSLVDEQTQKKLDNSSLADGQNSKKNESNANLSANDQKIVSSLSSFLEFAASLQKTTQKPTNGSAIDQNPTIPANNVKASPLSEFYQNNKNEKQQILEKREKLMELFTDVSFLTSDDEIADEHTDKDKFDSKDLEEDEEEEEDEEISKINSGQNSKKNVLEGYANLRFTPSSATPKKDESNASLSANDQKIVSSLSSFLEFAATLQKPTQKPAIDQKPTTPANNSNSSPTKQRQTTILSNNVKISPPKPAILSNNVNSSPTKQRQTTVLSNNSNSSPTKQRQTTILSNNVKISPPKQRQTTVLSNNSNSSPTKQRQTTILSNNVKISPPKHQHFSTTTILSSDTPTSTKTPRNFEFPDTFDEKPREIKSNQASRPIITQVSKPTPTIPAKKPLNIDLTSVESDNRAQNFEFDDEDSPKPTKSSSTVLKSSTFSPKTPKFIDPDNPPHYLSGTTATKSKIKKKGDYVKPPPELPPFVTSLKDSYSSNDNFTRLYFDENDNANDFISSKNNSRSTTPRKVTNSSSSTTPRSKNETPRSKNETPRSKNETPRSKNSNSNSRTTTPRDLAISAAILTPVSGRAMTPRAKVFTTGDTLKEDVKIASERLHNSKIHNSPTPKSPKPAKSPKNEKDMKEAADRLHKSELQTIRVRENSPFFEEYKEKLEKNNKSPQKIAKEDGEMLVFHASDVSEDEEDEEPEDEEKMMQRMEKKIEKLKIQKEIEQQEIEKHKKKLQMMMEIAKMEDEVKLLKKTKEHLSNKVANEINKSLTNSAIHQIFSANDLPESTLQPQSSTSSSSSSGSEKSPKSVNSSPHETHASKGTIITPETLISPKKPNPNPNLVFATMTFPNQNQKKEKERNVQLDEIVLDEISFDPI